ncbi:MAG: hypothetical protein WKG03_00395 [Telluria sp.]
MKKDAKLPSVVAAEKAEANALAENILRITERIPSSVINHPGVMYARDFKARMVKARLLSTATTKNLLKLRAAMQDVRHYYGASA